MLKSFLNKIMPKNIYQIKNPTSSNVTITVGKSTTSVPINMGSASTISIVGGGGGGGGTYGPIYNTNATTTAASSGRIHVQGDAVFEGKITWQGRDMREWFESVESRLAILQPNPELEKNWDELAQLRQQYVELERELLEKQRVFDILKKE
jgi:hypothetical protein